MSSQFIHAPLPGDADLLALMVKLAVEAGRPILDIYARPFEIIEKADGTPVTQADEAAEAVILAGLAQFGPGVPVVAEEACAASGLPTATGPTFFLVDPLDGTREFVARNGDFTVNIALVRDGRPVLGVVYAPARGVLHAGRPGEAFRMSVDSAGVCGTREPIAASAPASPVRVLASRSHRDAQTDAWLARMPDARIASIGSSLKFCLIAEGQADLYPRFGPTMEWDTAAGDAVLRAAGGMTVTADGEPLRYGKRTVDAGAYRNPHFIAFGLEPPPVAKIG